MKLFHTIKELQQASVADRLITSITEDALLDFPVIENQEPLVNLEEMVKKQHSRLMVALVWDKKDLAVCRTRKTVAEKLLRIQARLPKHLCLKVTDAHRPLALQRKLFKQIWEQVHQDKPKLKGKSLYREVTNFIADPDRLPPHSTGGAIDLTLHDIKQKKDVDMGTSVDAISELAMTFHPKLSKKYLNNRLVLFHAMSSEGFTNIASEWWHYSYGDPVWAASHGVQYAIYGSK